VPKDMDPSIGKLMEGVGAHKIWGHAPRLIMTKKYDEDVRHDDDPNQLTLLPVGLDL
jgi:hypothetical protein